MFQVRILISLGDAWTPRAKMKIRLRVRPAALLFIDPTVAPDEEFSKKRFTVGEIKSGGEFPILSEPKRDPILASEEPVRLQRVQQPCAMRWGKPPSNQL